MESGVRQGVTVTVVGVLLGSSVLRPPLEEVDCLDTRVLPSLLGTTKRRLSQEGDEPKSTSLRTISVYGFRTKDEPSDFSLRSRLLSLSH